MSTQIKTLINTSKNNHWFKVIHVFKDLCLSNLLVLICVSSYVLNSLNLLNPHSCFFFIKQKTRSCCHGFPYISVMNRNH
jgi:hypothetical protein